ncbi:MAG: hypothetical protein H7Y86_20115 [Rhizobacter sp.]|nr:hypothetical protein [Ferruginibacter sp.]
MKLLRAAAAAITCCAFLPVYAQLNVGIGTNDPLYKLDVFGTSRITENLYVTGNIGIGTTTSNYRLQIDNGAMAIFNTTDNKVWAFNYNSSANYFQLTEGGIGRIVVANGGNVGINTTTPVSKLDVNGTMNVETNLSVGGNISMAGNGLLYNAASSAKLRYFTKQVSFAVTAVGPHGIGPEGVISYTGFTSPPVIIVGNLVSSSGSAGVLYKCELVVYDVTATSAKARVSNTSSTTITQSSTWNVVCIGN